MRRCGWDEMVALGGYEVSPEGQPIQRLATVSTAAGEFTAFARPRSGIASTHF